MTQTQSAPALAPDPRARPALPLRSGPAIGCRRRSWTGRSSASRAPGRRSRPWAQAPGSGRRRRAPRGPGASPAWRCRGGYRAATAGAAGGYGRGRRSGRAWPRPSTSGTRRPSDRPSPCGRRPGASAAASDRHRRLRRRPSDDGSTDGGGRCLHAPRRRSRRSRRGQCLADRALAHFADLDRPTGLGDLSPRLRLLPGPELGRRLTLLDGCRPGLAMGAVEPPAQPPIAPAPSSGPRTLQTSARELAGRSLRH